MRDLLVFGTKTFKISIPDDSKVTFGPFSPPTTNSRGYGTSPDRLAGTLRIYGKSKEHVLAVFAHVTGFRDLSINYSELVAREEGAAIWKSDERGYEREEKVKSEKAWVSSPELETGEEVEVEEVDEADFMPRDDSIPF